MGTAGVGISPGPSPKVASEPTPLCPDKLRPQQWTLRSSSSAQVCDSPAAIATAPRPSAAAGEGISPGASPTADDEPMPSCPLLFRPQQWTLLSSSNAQICPDPAVIATALRPEASGVAGLGSSPGWSPKSS